MTEGMFLPENQQPDFEKAVEQADQANYESGRLYKITFSPNGHVSASDASGVILQSLSQKGWLQLYFEYLESQGIDPTRIYFEAILNQGTWMRIKPYKLLSGEWNYVIDGNMA